MAAVAASIGLLPTLAFVGSIVMALVVPVASFFSASVARWCAAAGAAPCFVGGAMAFVGALSEGSGASGALLLVAPAALVLVMAARPLPVRA